VSDHATALREQAHLAVLDAIQEVYGHRDAADIDGYVIRVSAIAAVKAQVFLAAYMEQHTKALQDEFNERTKP